MGEFLALAVRLNRLASGLADVGDVDPGLRQRVAAEGEPVPSDLVRQAGRLTREAAGVDGGPDRRAFLLGQLRAMECTARRLTGQPVPFVREIRECFDVTVRLGVEDEYRQAHAELDELLPGPQPLADRLARYRVGQEVPRERLGDALVVLSDVMRDRSRAVLGLPEGESVSFRIVDDAPWSALHQYRGGYRSRVTVNAGARTRRVQLAQLVAHEAYPGHHTERCHKQDTLVRVGWAEHAGAARELATERRGGGCGRARAGRRSRARVGSDRRGRVGRPRSRLRPGARHAGGRGHLAAGPGPAGRGLVAARPAACPSRRCSGTCGAGC